MHIPFRDAKKAAAAYAKKRMAGIGLPFLIRALEMRTHRLVQLFVYASTDR